MLGAMSDHLGIARRRVLVLTRMLQPEQASVIGDGLQVHVPPLPHQQSLTDIRSGDNTGRTWAKTDLGMVHYRVYRPDAVANHRIVVLVHGFSMPGTQHMASMAEALASRGLPVLVLDLFGRGLSDRPLVRYDGALYVRCVVDLLGALGFDGKQVDLLGFSMGGQIVQEIAVRRPELVRRMVLCAPGGTSLKEPSPSSRLAVQRYGLALMTSAIEGGVTSWEAYYTAQYGRFKAYGMPHASFKALMAGVLDNSVVEFNGFAYSLGSSLLDFTDASEVNERRLRELGKLGKPSIAIWGTADTDVPYKNHKNLLRHVPHCVLHSFADRSHMFLMDKENTWILKETVADFLLGP